MTLSVCLCTLNPSCSCVAFVAVGIYCGLPCGAPWADFVHTSPCLFVSNMDVMWNSRALCGSLYCMWYVLMYARLSVLSTRWVIPSACSHKHLRTSHGTFLLLLAPGDTSARSLLLLFIYILLLSSTHPAPVGFSVVWQIKGLRLLHRGFSNIWNTPSTIYQRPICQVHLTYVSVCVCV